MSRKGSLTKGGIVTNLDTPLDAKTKAEVVDAEAKNEAIDKAKADAKKRGGDNFAVYHQSELDSGKATAYKGKEYSSLDPRSLANRPRLEAGIRITGPGPEDWQWILNDLEYDAVAEGYFCPNCLMAQKQPQTNMCYWRDRPVDSDVPGCGYSRIADKNIGTNAYKE